MLVKLVMESWLAMSKVRPRQSSLFPSLPTLRFLEKESFQDFLPTVTAQLSEVEVGVENDPSASAVLLQSIVR